jgi:hypothetical protein
MRRREERAPRFGGGEAWPQQTLVGVGPGARPATRSAGVNVGKRGRTTAGRKPGGKLRPRNPRPLFLLKKLSPLFLLKKLKSAQAQAMINAALRGAAWSQKQSEAARTTFSPRKNRPGGQHTPEFGLM